MNYNLKLFLRYGKILILSLSVSEEDILKKLLKAVEGSVDIEDRTLLSEKIELAELQILLPEKMGYRRCGLDRGSHGL